MHQSSDKRTVMACTVALEGRHAIDYTTALFGGEDAERVKATILEAATSLTENGPSASWSTYAISNGSFFMAPGDDELYWAADGKGASYRLSATGFGLACCLRALRRLSARGDDLGQLCDEHHDLLKRVALERSDACQVMACST